MKLLVISNGHGEDAIAVRIVEQLQHIAPKLEIVALPIVGEGLAYQKCSVPFAGKVQTMPSGGFVYMSGEQLAADLRGGLFQLTLHQLKVVHRWGKTKNPILAVGDIVPLLFARLSGSPYAFVGTAKSEYYLRDSNGEWLDSTPWLQRFFGSDYLPWEKWLLKQATGIYPRDRLTCSVLQQQEVLAIDAGNPMMDGFQISQRQERKESQLTVVLLPGSRMPEAMNNWQQILKAVNKLTKMTQYKLSFEAAIAPGIDINQLVEKLLAAGWEKQAHSQKMLFAYQEANLWLRQNAYESCLEEADIAIAMAGTATEQFVGLGKPAITMSGTGAQCTPAFMEAQSRLLGCSILWVQHPDEVADAIEHLLSSPALQQQIYDNGRARMGTPGAAARIARHLKTTLLKSFI